MCKLHSIPSHGSYCDIVSLCHYPFSQDERCNRPAGHLGLHDHLSTLPYMEEGWGFYDSLDVPRQEMNKRRIKLHECDDPHGQRVDEPLSMIDSTDDVLTFAMIRDADSSGVSGTGKVLEGVVFSDGTVAVRWVGEKQSTTVYDDFRTFMDIHVNPHPFNSTTIEFSNGKYWKQEADREAIKIHQRDEHYGHTAFMGMTRPVDCPYCNPNAYAWSNQ